MTCTHIAPATRFIWRWARLSLIILFSSVILCSYGTLGGENLTSLENRTGPGARYLAAELVELDASLLSGTGLADTPGLLVISPLKNGPSEKAGVLAGDIILALNNRRVGNFDDLINAIGDARKQGDIGLEIWRRGERIRLTVRIENEGDEVNSGSIEQSIDSYKSITQVFSKDAFPQLWAAANAKLGILFWIRLEGDHEQNLNEAIEAFKGALQIVTNERFPEEWARLENNLALVYMERMEGGRADNVEAAIKAHTAALTVLTRERFPEEWARTQNNLGIAFAARLRGSRTANLDAAIEAHKLAMTILTAGRFPQDWARSDEYLNSAYALRSQAAEAGKVVTGPRESQAAGAPVPKNLERKNRPATIKSPASLELKANRESPESKRTVSPAAPRLERKPASNGKSPDKPAGQSKTVAAASGEVAKEKNTPSKKAKSKGDGRTTKNEPRPQSQPADKSSSGKQTEKKPNLPGANRETQYQTQPQNSPAVR
jgi:tetratricopeptide (TPR) repeat protein